MPRGHYERKPAGIRGRRMLRVVDPNQETNQETLVIENGEYVSLEHANAKIADNRNTINMLESELTIAKSDASLLETRCALYERLLDRLSR